MVDYSVISADAMRTMMEAFGEDMVDKMKGEVEKIYATNNCSYVKQEEVRLHKAIQLRLEKDRKIIFEQLGIIAGKMEKIDGQTMSIIAKMERWEEEQARNQKTKKEEPGTSGGLAAALPAQGPGKGPINSIKFPMVLKKFLQNSIKTAIF